MKVTGSKNVCVSSLRVVCCIRLKDNLVKHPHSATSDSLCLPTLSLCGNCIVNNAQIISKYLQKWNDIHIRKPVIPVRRSLREEEMGLVQSVIHMYRHSQDFRCGGYSHNSSLIFIIWDAKGVESERGHIHVPHPRKFISFIVSKRQMM